MDVTAERNDPPSGIALAHMLAVEHIARFDDLPVRLADEHESAERQREKKGRQNVNVPGWNGTSTTCVRSATR